MLGLKGIVQNLREMINEMRPPAMIRILQAALNNIAWHSNATWIEVILERDDRQALLEIPDEGQGIAVAGNLGDYSGARRGDNDQGGSALGREKVNHETHEIHERRKFIFGEKER